MGHENVGKVTVAVPALNPWEMSFNGVTFGGDTALSVASVEGLADLPAIITSDRDRLRQHGRTPGADFLGGREVTVGLEVFGGTEAAFTTAVQALQAVTMPGDPEAPLYFRVPGIGDSGVCYVNARPRKRSMPVATEFYYRIPVASVAFSATDPRIYSGTAKQTQTTNPVTFGGLAFNATADFSFGGVTSSGTVTATNAGTFQTPLRFRIDGPVVDPVITNVVTGERLALTITLASGQYLDICTAGRTVLLNGTASRYSSLTADTTWMQLPPGNSEFQFRATTDFAGQLTISWADAWV